MNLNRQRPPFRMLGSIYGRRRPSHGRRAQLDANRAVPNVLFRTWGKSCGAHAGLSAVSHLLPGYHGATKVDVRPQRSSVGHDMRVGLLLGRPPTLFLSFL